MSIAALLPTVIAARNVLQQLADGGVEFADLWVAARDEAFLSDCVKTGIATVHEGARRQGIVADLARVTGLAKPAERGALDEALVARGLDPQRASYFARELAEGNVLVGISSHAETEARAVVLRDAGADFGLANGAGLDTIVPLRREVLDVVKHTVVDAEVSVRTEIITETKRVDVVLEREEFVIEHRDLSVAGAPITITRIPIRHEEAIFNKRVVVTAEVHVRTEQHVDTSTVTETLRHEILQIDDPAGVVRRDDD